MPRDSHSSSIAEQQDEFARALLGEADIPAALTAPHRGAPAARRFQIYRNNVFASLTRCLALRFPAVARLVGEDFFNATARVFVERHPPVSPALLEYGEEFPDFLATFAPARSVPYLADVARLEWLVAAAYHARDAAPAGAESLGRLGDRALEAVLRLHPSCALFTSRYPAFSIWQTNTRDEVVRSIDARPEGEAALIVRPRFDVRVIPIDTATFAFIAALRAGHWLELSAEVAAEVGHRFDVGAALQLLFANGAIIGVEPAQSFQVFEPHSMRMMSCAT